VVGQKDIARVFAESKGYLDGEDAGGASGRLGDDAQLELYRVVEIFSTHHNLGNNTCL
jgi:hypothetical protein